MTNRILYAVTGAVACAALTSCLGDGEGDKYEDWRKKNDAYIAAIDTKEYERIAPDWAPQNPVYIKWHNDRALTEDNLVAMSNSTVNIKYELENIDGVKLENSYSVASGDSVYQSTPNSNVIGMWIAMTTMHVGDSATVVIPYPSGYNSASTSKVIPYSNLIFHMKIKEIVAYEKPNS